MKPLLTVGFLISTAFAATLAFAQSADGQVDPDNLIDFGDTEPLVVVSENGEHTFQVEIADTLAKQAQGYMFREVIEPGNGMLFEFDQPKIATIYMKNTPLPLDIIFVRSNGRILKIEHNAQPYKLRSASSEAPVAAVLELPGGQSKDLGILPGDTVRHEFFGTAE